MTVLYSCVIEGVQCLVVQNQDLYFCQVADRKYPLKESFTNEEKSLSFLMECIIAACYKKYAASKELEAIYFD